MKTIGDNIKYWRTERNMYQRELADKIYVTSQAVQQWERNRTLPTLDNIKAIAEVLNVSVYHILYDDTEPFKHYDLDYTELYEDKKASYAAKNYTHAVRFMNDKLKNAEYKLIHHTWLTQFEYYQFILWATEHRLKDSTDNDLMLYLLRHRGSFNMLFVEPYIVERLMTGQGVIF